jgi:hypothetical protein
MLSIRMISLQALFCLVALTALGDDADFTVTKQTPYLYTANRAYFDTAPPTHFTVRDFTRTNEVLGKKYGDGSSDGKSHVTLHLEAFIIPMLSDDQYSVRIVSDHALPQKKVEEIVQFAEKLMFAR